MSAADSSPSGLRSVFSTDEAHLLMDGLTQTCAALRRRIAELEADNRVLQRASKAAVARHNNGCGSKAGSRVSDANGQVSLSQEGVAIVGVESDANEKAGFVEAAAGGPSEKAVCTGSPGQALEAFTPLASAVKAQEEGARRVSSTANRARYSAGFSRFSLPSSLSPSRGDASIIEEDVDGSTPQEKARGVLEGLLTLAHPITGDEKELTFLEFAEVGIGAVTLSGARPLQPWGQDVEVLSAFPGSDDHSTKGSRAEAGAARDGSLVQGLGEFCFPSGANISLVRAERGALEGVPEDRLHLVQFTDCDNTSTYGCCVTVTHLLQDPPARLVQRLQERELIHSAARSLQRFLRRVRASKQTGSRGRRQLPTWSSPVVDSDAWLRPSRFGYQTPPPGGLSSSGAPALEQSPTSISGMINRLFSSSPGIEGGGGGGSAVGGVSYPVLGDATARGRGAVGAAPSLGAEGWTPTLARAVLSPASRSMEAAGVIKAERMARVNSPADRFSARSTPSPPTRTISPHPAVMPRSILPTDVGGGGGGVTVRGGRGFGRVESENFPGMFSDDESESDAGQSTDRESTGSRGSEDDDCAESERGRFVGRDGVVWQQARRASPSGAIARRERGETVRDSPPASRANVSGGVESASGKAVWAVTVERCYVMLGCHRNQPLMLKVLKAVADSERLTRSRTSASSSSISPPRPQSAGKPGTTTHEVRPSPPRRLEAGGSNGATPDESPQSASRFRTVAAAAEEEAKSRHRRMLRDKFLHQVRTDKAKASRASIEEGKKVSIHCPAFLRAPLEVTAAPLETWLTAVLFASVPEATILRAVDVLLLEKTLVVCGRDLGMVSMTATALLTLLDPFKWEGVFVPVVPLKLMEVLDSPVPALVGVQAPFKLPLLGGPLGFAVDGIVVLDLDARPASVQLFMGSMDDKLPVSDDLIGALEEANALRGRGRFTGATASSRSPLRRPNSANAKENVRTTGAGTMSPGRRSHFSFQASTFMSGLTPEEKATVARLRGIVKTHVSALCGDLGIRGTWRKYGSFDSGTYQFNFQPDWFTEPFETRFKFQAGVARTQMFVSYVDRCRLRDLEGSGEDRCGRDPYTPPKTSYSTQPLEGLVQGHPAGKQSAHGRAPPLPARGGHQISPGRTKGAGIKG